MSDYIHKGSARETFCLDCRGVSFGNCEYTDTRQTQKVIDKIPSADVVEVVRCKDCKQFEKHSGHIGNIQYNGYCKGTGDWVNPTDYCSWGERKDNEID